MTEIFFDPNKEINPHFYDVWMTNKTFNILSGGRNSFKSSVVSLKLCWDMLIHIARGERANVVIIRKVASTIKDSVFMKIQWVLTEKLGIMDQFTTQKRPYIITHKGTGSSFYFYGQDDFQKLKSNDLGDIIAVWYEEAAEFKDAEEFDQSNITFMRQNRPNEHVQFFWSYNPPRNPFHWINEWSKKVINEPNYLVHHSSYLNDILGFSDEMLPDIERVKRANHSYYEYLYLGIPSRDENYFFPDIVIDNADPLKQSRYFLGVDSAYKGKDSIVATISCIESGKLRILDSISIKKDNWKDGVTSVAIVNELLKIIRYYHVELVCCDVGYGVYIIEELAKKADNFRVQGINFGSAPTKRRQELHHHAATKAQNSRAEMHITLQELMMTQKITFTEKMKNKLEEQMSFISEEIKSNGKTGIVSKEEIKKQLGHSPDELDSALLSIHAFMLSSLTTGLKFIYEEVEL